MKYVNDSGLIMRCMSGRYGGPLCGLSKAKETSPNPNRQEAIQTQSEQKAKQTVPIRESQNQVKLPAVLLGEGPPGPAATGTWPLSA